MAINHPQLEFKEITFRYRKDRMFSFPSLTLYEHEQCLILGDSGSGKTTLLHILTGLLRPFTGTVLLNGVDIYRLSPKKQDQFRGKHIGLVFQQSHLIKSLTVLENMKLARWLAGLPIDKGELLAVLQRLGIADKATCYPYQLSQGQAQRAAIGRALINKPMILVADEPTSALDDRHAAIVLELLLEQSKGFGATLIIATHDKRIKDRISHTYQL